MKSKKINWKSIISILVLLSFMAPIGFLSYKIFTTTNEVVSSNLNYRVRSDYVLMLMQCLLGIFALGLPSVISKKFKLEIPNKVYYFYVLFLYAAIFLGEIRSFYYKFEHWDLLLHSCSSMMIGFLGFSVVDILNHDNKNIKLNNFFVAFFAFCFAVTLGAIWEMYEFVGDGLLNTNMQKFAIRTGIDLEGRKALIDTMGDLVVDGIGALIASILGYFSLKYDTNFLKNITIKINKKKKSNEVKTDEA